MEVGGTPLELWLALFAIISVMLSIDLFSDHFHKLFKSKKPSAQKRSYPFGTDALWTIIWLSLGSLFALIIYFSLGSQKAMEYATGYALEYSLSVDNMLVFVLIFTSFRIISKKDNKKLDIEKSLVVKILRKFTSIDTTSNDHKFIKVINGKMVVTPLLVALLSVEITDLVFALDSIPAILSITQDSFIVISSNIFAILGLRSLYFLIGSGIEKLHYLKYGLTVLLAFIGVKMIISEFVHIEVIHSLIVVFTILAITFVASILKARKST